MLSLVTDSAPSILPTSDVVFEHCWKCGHPTASDGRVDPLYCPSCCRKQAVVLLQTAREVVVSLRRGADVFAPISATDRDRLMGKLLDGIGTPLATVTNRPHSAHELDLQEFVGWRYAGPCD